MNEKEFEVEGYTYRGRRIPAMDLYDIARKWSPVLIWVASSAREVHDPATFARAFCAVSTAIPKSDSDLVMNLCLSSVVRKVPGDAGWAPVMGTGGNLRFEDIELSEMLQIVYHVLEFNKVVAFFKEPPATSPVDAAG